MTDKQPRVALITGATAGIGAGTAKKFADEGWHLVLTGRRENRLKQAQESLGVPVHTIVADVTDVPAMTEAFGALPAPFDAVEVLVNNAGHGIGTDAKFQDANLEQLHTMVEANINAVLTCTRLLLPGMIERGRGHIINLGSIFHRYPYPMSHVYNSTKAFVENLTQGIRADLLGTNVKVSTVEPGLVLTEFVERRFHGDMELIKKRLGDADGLLPEDIAECIWFCVNTPRRMTVSRLEVVMTDQAPAPNLVIN
ncbi:MAG: NAD(P)-dependent oxidoreductase [Alphaproteobacteria bacterium]|nr:NAD(P)-dependent oxidoreductase [Alphaproteobacteria bacterium]|tara:strand:- start:1452 stop:2213 length:762 start_codon:yes stop_codon:yes gene_type:complete